MILSRMFTWDGLGKAGGGGGGGGGGREGGVGGSHDTHNIGYKLESKLLAVRQHRALP